MNEHLKEVPKDIPVGTESIKGEEGKPKKPEKIMYLYKEKTDEGMVFVAKIQLDGKDAVRIEAPLINLAMDINVMMLSHLTARLHQFQKSMEEVEKLKGDLQVMKEAILAEQEKSIITGEEGGRDDKETRETS